VRPAGIEPATCGFEVHRSSGILEIERYSVNELAPPRSVFSLPISLSCSQYTDTLRTRHEPLIDQI